MRSSAWRRSTSGSGQSGLSRRNRQVAAKLASVRGATRRMLHSTIAVEQRVAEVGDGRARIGPAAFVHGLVGGGKGGRLGGESGFAEPVSACATSLGAAGRRHQAARAFTDRLGGSGRNGWPGCGRCAAGCPIGHAPHAGVGCALRWLIAALAAQNGDAALLGGGRNGSGQAGEQDEGVERSFHARNRRQGLAASQWQVAHLAGTGGGA